MSILTLDILDIFVKIVQIITCLSFIIAIFQLRATSKNAKVNILKTEFDIFGKISEKEKIFVDCYEKLISSNELINKEDYNLYIKSQEQYLSELNLVCLYILEGYFTKKHFFQEYGEKILFIYDEIKENDKIKKYTNINQICTKYKRKLIKYKT